MTTSKPSRQRSSGHGSLPANGELFWPTPQTMDTLPPRGAGVETWNNERDGRRNRRALSNLREAVHSPVYLSGLEDVLSENKLSKARKHYGTTGDLLPTPRPCSGKRSGGMNSTELLQSVERQQQMGLAPEPAEKPVGYRGGPLRPTGMLPTPTASDCRDGTVMRTGHNGHLGGRKNVGLNHLVEGLGYEGPTEPVLLPTPNVPNGGRGLPKGTTFSGRTATAPSGRNVQVELHHLAESGGLSQPDTPASRSPMPASARERMTPGTSGRTLTDSLPDFQPKSGPIGAFGKTFVGTSPWASTLCSLRWKTSVTPAKRTLFQLLASAPSTKGTGSGSSERGLFTTPTTDTAERSRPYAQGGQSLSYQASRMPFGTPTAGVGEKDAAPTEGMADRYLNKGKGGNLLETVAAHMWPTPTAAQNKNRDTGPAPSYLDGSHGWSLAAAVHDAQSDEPSRLWPTPTAAEGTGVRTQEAFDHEAQTRRAGRAQPGTLRDSVAVATAQRMCPTPRAGKTTEEDEAAWRARNEAGHVSTPPLSLAVKMWRTPAAHEPGRDAERLVDKDGNPPGHFNQRLYDKETGRLAQYSLTQEVAIAQRMRATPRAEGHDAGHHPGKSDSLDAQVRDEARSALLLPTPTTQDAKNCAGPSQFNRNTQPLNTAVATTPGQKLNADFVERLMGLPDDWTVLRDDGSAPAFLPPGFASPLDLFGCNREYEVPLTVSGKIPDRVNRLKALGNAVVPQIPFLIFTAINEAQS